MSSVRNTTAFSLISRKHKGPAKDVKDFYFPFKQRDLSCLVGHKHLLAEMGGVLGVAAALRSDPQEGLYKDEVDVGLDKRRAEFGVNFIPLPPLKSFWEHCADALKEPILIVLMLAGTVSFISGMVEHPSSGWIEGLAIVVTVFVVTGVSSLNNVQQEREFRRLDEDKEPEYYHVCRHGVVSSIPAGEIVTGDLVELAAGDEVPADGLFITGDDPAVSEAKMTGETKEIEKSQHEPFLMGGTEMKRGQCVMMAVATGINSIYGQILAGLVAPPDPTPLQEKLTRAAELIGMIGTGTSIALFIILGSFYIDDLVNHDGEKDAILQYFIIAVTVVVVAVPEGLPLAVTISLAYSMKKMVADMNLVRVLSACETMGNATAICSDKTGTLTKNEMTVIRGMVLGKQYDTLETTDLPQDAHPIVIEAIAVNSKAAEEPDEKHEGRKVWKGSQTEVALLKWLLRNKIDVDAARAQFLVEKNYPFDSQKKNSSVIIKSSIGDHGRLRRYWKGAAEILLGRSQFYLTESGEQLPLTEEARQRITTLMSSMTNTGLRSIAFTYQVVDKLIPHPEDVNKTLDPPEDLPMTFVGMVGIKDPLREESRASVLTCQRAGVVVRMVTGDHPATAQFIARECGILTSAKHVVMTGSEFQHLMNAGIDEQRRIIPNLRVLARSQPEDKRILVKWLKDNGDVVAATGDGTNDAPALKEAHVGFAMAIVGTAVAKAAAQILILDDNFASVVKSIMWGRCVYDNIRKFLQFQLTVNVAALIITLVGAFTKYFNPLRAVQLLWINLIMDTFGALALGTEQPTPDLLERKPYARDAPLISRLMWRNILGHAVLQLAVVFTILYAGPDISDGIVNKSRHHFTLIFNTFVYLQVFNQINARKVNNDQNVFSRFFANPMYAIILVIEALMQVFMVELFGPFAETSPLTAEEYFICIGLGALELPWGFILRLFPIKGNDGEIELPEDTFENEEHQQVEVVTRAVEMTAFTSVAPVPAAEGTDLVREAREQKLRAPQGLSESDVESPVQQKINAARKSSFAAPASD